MGTHFHVSAAHAALAVYDSASPTGDLDVLANPGLHLPAIKLHSSLHYPKIVLVQTGTTTFPAITSNTRRNATSTLFAHGRGGIPLVFGELTVGGVPIAWAGSVPVQVDDASGGFFGFPRTIALGADGTNVLVHENGISRDTGSNLGSIALSWKVYVTDLLL